MKSTSFVWLVLAVKDTMRTYAHSKSDSFSHLDAEARLVLREDKACFEMSKVDELSPPLIQWPDQQRNVFASCRPTLRDITTMWLEIKVLSQSIPTLITIAYEYNSHMAGMMCHCNLMRHWSCKNMVPICKEQQDSCWFVFWPDL